MASPLRDLLRNRARAVEAFLEASLQPAREDAAVPALVRLADAEAHGALAGGKRLRPFLVIEAAALCGERQEAALPAAAAIEMVHSYSLVHDDLPAMDDADTRRGKPSVHKAYDEAIAILAGDGLLTDAFAVLTRPGTYAPEIASRLVYELAIGAGSTGMVGGQMMDLYPGDLCEDEIVGIQRRKTGALIEAAVVMGGIVGRAHDADIDRLRTYAATLGEAFQIVDDILDETASAADLGKPAGADAAMGKATFVSFLGLDGARTRVAALTDAAEAAVAPFGPSSNMLRALARDLADRTH